MKLRTGSRGNFWSCCSYPACRGTLDASGVDGAQVKPSMIPPPPPLGVPPNAQPVYGIAPGRSDDPYQQAVIDWRRGWAVVAAAAGCHPAGTRVLKADGSTVAVEAVQVGDRLLGWHGPVSVLRLIQGVGEIYRVVPVKGAPFLVNSEHVLSLVESQNRFNGRPNVVDVRVCDITPRHLRDFKLFRAGVEVFENGVCLEDLPVHPYFLGLLIGDGSTGKNIEIGKPDPEIEAAVIEHAATWGLVVRTARKPGRCPIYRLSDENWRDRNSPYEKRPLRVALEMLGLYGAASPDRFVPPVYLTACRQSRLALLAGLLDTDGHMYGGMFRFTSASFKLANDVVFLARSLGFAAYLTVRTQTQGFSVGALCYVVCISGECSKIPTRIARKRAPQRKRKADVLRTGIKCIEPVGTAPFFGFTLDGDERYLLDDFTVTHNSGKTFSVIERTVSLISEGTVPEAICILAFNADAAATVRARLASRIGPAGNRVEASTFHSFAYALLRNWWPLDNRFLPGHLLGGRDGLHPIKLAIPICDAINKELRTELQFGAALRVYERFSEALLPISEVNVASVMGWGDSDEAQERAHPLTLFLRRWQEEKRKRDLIDFTDMICTVAQAITWQRGQPHVEHLAGMYQHVVVDECQDMSLPRAIIAQWMGQKAQSFMAVGDSRQGVNSFAGAKPEIFMNLARSPGVTLLTLPVNRRSTARIVEASNEISRNKDWNLGGDCIPRPDAPQGEPVRVLETFNASEEARDIISDIQRRVAHGLPLEINDVPSYACLARTNAMLVDLECAFVARGIPVRVSGSPGGVWGSSIGQELLAYLEGIEGIPTFSLLNVLNKPKRFAKKTDLGAVIEKAVEREKGGGNAALHDNLTHSQLRPLQKFGHDLERAARQSWAGRCLQVARWLGLDDDEDEEEAGVDRRAALESLMKLAQHLGSLKAIYEYKQAAAKGEKEPAVRLSTIHSSKGKEWPVVYVCGVCVDKLPHKRSATSDEVEEERRLFYVAVTRAQHVATVSTGGTPSRFLTDLGWVRDVIRSPA